MWTIKRRECLDLEVRAFQLLWPKYEVDHIQVLSDLVFTWNMDNKVKRMLNSKTLNRK